MDALFRRHVKAVSLMLIQSGTITARKSISGTDQQMPARQLNIYTQESPTHSILISIHHIYTVFLLSSPRSPKKENA
jgi:hypothetical protein